MSICQSVEYLIGMLGVGAIVVIIILLFIWAIATIGWNQINRIYRGLKFREFIYKHKDEINKILKQGD